MNRQQGFTLTEILITVAIIGILAAIAIPSFERSRLKANRADAHITMSRLATLQERFFFSNNQYSGDFADLLTGVTSGDPVDSDEEHYSIALTLTGGGTGWSMTATPQGVQANDTTCAELTMTSVGNKTAEDEDSNDTSDECWI